MLKSIKITAIMLLAMSAATISADAGQRYGKQPKLYLSPDLTSPWMLRLKP